MPDFGSDYALIGGGLLLLFVGGEMLVRGAVGMAERLGVSTLLIGLTVVAWGTSAPELTVAVEAALRGAPDIAVGGVVGSNIANILLVLGLTALIRPVIVQRSLVKTDGTFLLLVSAGFATLALSGAIAPAYGAAMVAILVLYTLVSFANERRRMRQKLELHTVELVDVHKPVPSLTIAVPTFAFGLAGVVYGADFLITGSIGVARTLGISEAVIGLSLVAVGTSLPELATSAIAAFRRQADVAIGNLVGSNLTNILGIIGITALFGKVGVAPQIAGFDVWVMLAVAIILIPVLWTGLRVSRREAFLFLVFYGAYIAALYTGVAAEAAAMVTALLPEVTLPTL